MMLHSAEMRWFFVGPAPEWVPEWFDAGEGRLSERLEKLRTDSYLVFFGSLGVGVKLREAPGKGRLNFEIKALRSAPKLEPSSLARASWERRMRG